MTTNFATYGRDGESEARTREDLAACFRLVARLGWDDPIFRSHFTVRLPGSRDRLLTNPYHVPYQAISASDLIVVELEPGAHGSTMDEVDFGGLVLHRAIHSARPDVNCVMHLHTPNGTAVSALEDGLLPLSQPALIVQSMIAYHSYSGLATESAEAADLVCDLANKQLVLLRNHGTFSVAPTIPQAFVFLYFLEQACEIQIKILSMNRPIITVPPSIQQIVARQIQMAGRDTAEQAWRGLLKWVSLQDSDEYRRLCEPTKSDRR